MIFLAFFQISCGTSERFIDCENREQDRDEQYHAVREKQDLKIDLKCREKRNIIE